jgi:cell shape-determining protein MreC
MEEVLLKNAEEFYLSGEDNLLKKRFNAAYSDFFKALVIFCDYLIYNQIKRLPKNHVDRFILLESYFSEIYKGVSEFFKEYTFSYNSIIVEKEVIKLKKYVAEIQELVRNKKRA